MKNLSVLLLSAVFLLSGAVPAKSPEFPLGNHSSWQYTGTIKVSQNPAATPFEMRMDVIESIRRGNIRAAWVRGNPLGLTDPNTGDYVIAQDGNRLYVVESERTGEVLSRLRNASDDLAGLLNDPEVVLNFPLAVGTKTCNAGSGGGKDSCWEVTAEKSPDEHKYPSTECEYEITSRDANGFRTIWLVPDIGITGFEFQRDSKREWAKVRLGTYDLRDE